MTERVTQNTTTKDESLATENIPRKRIDATTGLRERLPASVVEDLGPSQYFMTDENNDAIEDWSGLFYRVAGSVADIEYAFGADQRLREQWENRFVSAMKNLQFLPSTPILMSVGAGDRDVDLSLFPSQTLINTGTYVFGFVNLSLLVKKNTPSFDEFAQRYPDRDLKTVASSYLNRSCNYTELESTIETGVRFLDNTLETFDPPIDGLSEEAQSKRAIGLGVMGFAEMLIQMGILYGSPASQMIAHEIMRRVDMAATEYSHTLGKIRDGFDGWSDSNWAAPRSNKEWFRSHAYETPEAVDPRGYLMRNDTVTTSVSDNGVSRIADTSCGCEPIDRKTSFVSGLDLGDLHVEPSDVSLSEYRSIQNTLQE